MILNLSENVKKEVIETRRVIRNIQSRLRNNKIHVIKTNGYNTIISSTQFWQCEKSLTNYCIKEKKDYTNSQFCLVMKSDLYIISEYFNNIFKNELMYKIEIIKKTIEFMKNSPLYNICHGYKLNYKSEDIDLYIYCDLFTLTLVTRRDISDFNCNGNEEVEKERFNFNYDYLDDITFELKGKLEYWSIEELKKVYHSVRYKVYYDCFNTKLSVSDLETKIKWCNSGKYNKDKKSYTSTKYNTKNLKKGYWYLRSLLNN